MSVILIPTIYKPTRITEHSTLTNVESAIIVTYITDHLPTVLFSNIDTKEKSQSKQPSAMYKHRHTDDDIKMFKSKLSKTNWQNVFVCGNANDDYDAFVKKFNDLYDACIPFKKCPSKHKWDAGLLWITKGILKCIRGLPFSME